MVSPSLVLVLYAFIYFGFFGDLTEAQRPGSASTFGFAGKVVFEITVEGTGADLDLPFQFARAVEEAVERVDAEEVHRDHQRRLERLQHLDHAVGVERHRAVDRHEHGIEAADLVELLLVERVVQMAEMADAQIGDLEDEDRVAVPLGAAVDQLRMLVGTLRTRTSRTCTSCRAGRSGLGPQPRSTCGMRGSGRSV